MENNYIFVTVIARKKKSRVLYVAGSTFNIRELTRPIIGVFQSD